MIDIKDVVGTYLFPGKVRIDVKKVTDDRVKVTIDRGAVDFDVDHMPEYWGTPRDEINGIQYNPAPIIQNARWRLTSNDFYIGYSVFNSGDNYIENGGIYTIDKAVKIINAFNDAIDVLVKVGYIDVELLTREQMKDLLNQGILASEVSKYGWKLYKAYAVQNSEVKCLKNIPIQNCAMCYANPSLSCGHCLLYENGCAGNTYNETRFTNTNAEFIEACDKMLDKIHKVMIKERGMKYMKSEEQIIMNYKFGDIEICVNKTKENDKFTLTITGMKALKDLSDEYLNGYPYCYYDNNDGSFKLRCSDGMWIESDGDKNSYCGDWLFTKCDNDYSSRFSITVVKNIINEIEKCVERLREINKPKEKETEMLFNGLCDNVESIVYDFNGCCVKIHKYGTLYEINIDPGNFNFKCKDRNSRGIYSFERGSYNYDWRIGEVLVGSPGIHYFNNGFTFSVEDINKILTHVKYEVENMIPSAKVQLMTSKEVDDLIDEGKLLPAEIAKKKWMIFKEYVLQNNINCRDDIEIIENDYNTCALCIVYNSDCDMCSLNKCGYRCSANYSPYNKIIDYYGKDQNVFISRIDSMINALDEAVEYEKKEKQNDDFVEIPDGKCTFNFNGIDIITTPIDCNKFSIDIHINGKKLDESKNIKINNETVTCYFWQSLCHTYDWYIHCTIMKNMKIEDREQFISGRFNNGIILSREGTALLVTILKKLIETEV